MPPKRKHSDLSSLLFSAVNNTDLRTVECLLVQGADPNQVFAEGLAAVHLAAGKESEKGLRCLKLLLQHRADPNLRSNEDLTPLHIAALWGCYQNLKLLLKNGGNPSLRDQDGNKPADLAEQEENSKCASILQDYESQAPQVEYEDLPKFQYSIFSGNSMTDSSVGLSSMLSDFTDDPLSSTRQSSVFRMSGVHGQPSRAGGGGGESWMSEVSGLHMRDSDVFERSGACGEAPPVLSSTRLSVLDFRRSPEGALLHTNPNLSPDLQRCARVSHPGRKSVTFRDSNEYFPAPNSPLCGKENSDYSDTTVDFSQYPNFLDSERMATALQNQGIDVTSPEGVFVFCRGGSMLEEDFEKTIIVPGLLEKLDDGTDDDDDDEVFTNNANKVKDNVHAPVFSSSGSSKYSSCDSDQFKSALEGPVHTGNVSPCNVFKNNDDQNPSLAESPNHFLTKSTDSDRTENEIMKEQIGYISPLKKGSVFKNNNDQNPSLAESINQFQRSTDSDRNEKESMKAQMENISPLKKGSVFKNMDQNPFVAESINQFQTRSTDSHRTEQESMKAEMENKVVDLEERLADISLTPSPFVTGRTRSRLSRCSQRSSNVSQSLFSSSSLFEDTLPTPSRMRRNTVKSPHFSGEYKSKRSSEHSSLQVSSSQSSDDHPSQADTIMISGSMADTVIIPRSQEDEVESLERETSTLYEETDFLTSDVSTSTENTERPKDAHKKSYTLKHHKSGFDSQIEESQSHGSGSSSSLDSRPQSATLTEKPAFEENEFLTSDVSTSNDDTGSQKSSQSLDSQEDSSSPSKMSSESSLDWFNPQKGSSSGCTPRYSMSRLYHHSKPQTLANLSYTPGGRPLITDTEEPVEYLYTDTEEGHELIETHVPPTSNTSLSSSILTSSSEDTVLYDWRSLTGSPEKEKENRRPGKDHTSETKGLTDRELRRRLVEFGEAPGPINSHTRPLYIHKLRSLQNSSANQQPAEDHSSAYTGYSPELNKVLCTFHLPDCKADEFALCEQFDQPDQNKRWREGIIKSSFNYLLLDPRVTKNLPYRSQSMTPQECFQTFISAIFYIGKGKRSRPYSHLYEALEYFKGDKTSKKLSLKVQHILQVWSCGQGVISLHCFQNVIPVEAFTREASMVDAIGLKMLTNQKRGDYYGVASTWTVKRKRELGVHLLYRTMQIFQAEGERQLRPADIRQ